jgi:hypothetical protein
MNTSSSCQSPLDWRTLVAYWLGELDPDSEARTEEHYLGCAQCSRRLEELASLAQGIRALTRASGVNAVISEAFVQRLVEHGLQVREYRVPLNGSVNCTVAPEDDFVVSRLEAPLAGVTRLDLVYVYPEGAGEMRYEDIPFAAASGGVVVSTPIDTVLALPTITLQMRLLAVDNGSERVIGEYTFNHTPSEQAKD